MAHTDHRTQVYLTAEQYRAAKRLAGQRGDSLAGVIREALAAYLATTVEDGRSVRWSGDPLEGLAGTLALAPLPSDGEDLDAAIDASVYDEV